MRRKMDRSQLKGNIKQLVIRDSDILAKMVCEAVINYKVKDLEISWKRLLKSEIFTSAIHDVLATIPIKKQPSRRTRGSRK